MKRYLPVLALAVLFAAGVLVGHFTRIEKGCALAEPVLCLDGDVNGDGQLNISDPVYTLQFLFLGTDPPVHCTPATEAVSTVILVRHAEKLADGTDPGLTPEGQARAQRLAYVLAQAPVTNLIASDLKRTQETLQPLADLKSLPMDRIAASADVVDRLKSLPAGSLAVVAHHSFTLPDIIKGLEVEDGGGLTWGTDVYDNFLVVLRPGGGKAQPIPLKY